jgi:hypothetical protein
LGLSGDEGLAALSYLCATGRSLPTVLEAFSAAVPAARAQELFAPHWQEALAALPDAVREGIPTLATFCQGYPDRLYQRLRQLLETQQQEALEQATVEAGVGVRQQRRLVAVRMPGASSWLTARPTGTGDRCYLSPDDSRFCYRYWLGLQLAHMAQLGAADPYDAHDLLRGPVEGAVILVHGAVQRELLAILEAQGERPSWEDEGIFAHCPEPHRPDLVWGDRVSWVPHAIDVVTVGAQGQSADGTRDTADVGERRKAVEYASVLAHTPGVTLVAFGIDTFGGLGQGARRFLALLAERRMQHMRRVEDDEVDTRLRYFYTQRVVLALLRAQAHVVRRRCEQRCPTGWQAALERTLLHDHTVARAAALDGEPADPPGQADLAIVDVPLMAT